MIKFSSTKEMSEELVRLHNVMGSLHSYVKNVDSLQRETHRMVTEIKYNQEQNLKSQNIIQEDNNETTFKLLNENKYKSDFCKLLDKYTCKPWLNDFEVSMVEKALNIQLYPWQKEFLKGSNCVDINKGSGKTFILTLAYTLKLISLNMFINYDNDVHRCLLTPVYSNTETYIGEMFSDFWEKLSSYPFELNTTLELKKFGGG